MRVKICSYSEQYKDEVIRLILKIQREEFGLAIGIKEQYDLLDITSHYLEKGHFWLALDDENKLAGTIALVKLDNGASALKKMFVRNDLRRFGLGRQLMETCLTYCQGINITSIYLGTVSSLLQAQKFYQNMGFQEIGKGELPYDFPILDLDNVFYHYSLK